jgi:hypothetical protein
MLIFEVELVSVKAPQANPSMSMPSGAQPGTSSAPSPSQPPKK